VITHDAKIGLSKIIFCVKTHQNLSDFFFIEEKEFRSTYFLLKRYFDNFNFKTTFLLKFGIIFDKGAKIDKASWDAHN
jgi:hypothetical protein